MDVLRYRCSSCGAEHEGLPDMAFDRPIYASQVPEAERPHRVKLGSDACVIDSEDRFIRGCLEIPILGTGVSFTWGAWVSLSERNFQRYLDLFHADPPADEGPYFGWFSNRLPGYPDTLNLKTRVHLRPGRKRSLLELEPTEHPLAVHQRAGIPLLDLLAILGERVHAPVACPLTTP